MPWGKLPSNGVTPVKGKVSGVCRFGDVVNISQRYRGLLPRPAVAGCGIADLPRHTKGQEVTVYINGRNTENHKLQLALAPTAHALFRIGDLICDGRYPYPGTVRRVEDIGAFIDIGCERMAFLPRAAMKGDLRDGDRVITYVTKRHLGVRITVSLTPGKMPRTPFGDIAADGQTVYQGVVQRVEGNDAFIDIGCEMVPCLRLDPERDYGSALTPGAAISVYAVAKESRGRKVWLSLERRETPIKQLQDLVVDGQTPYDGVVTICRTTSGAVLVDIGCEELAVMSTDDPIMQGGRLAVGTPVTVYITSRAVMTGKVSVTSVRRSRPLLSMMEVAGDGVTPYDATVNGVTGYGTFFDMELEVPALMTMEPGAPKLAVGDKAKVYVWHRNENWGRFYVKTWPREKPAVPLKQLLADGVTPVDGAVLAQRGYSAYIDVGSDTLAVLKQDGFGAAHYRNREVERLQVGQPIRVYILRKNLVTAKVSVALHPDPAPRTPLHEIQIGTGRYKGIVGSVQYGCAFVDLNCDTTGYIPLEEAEAGVAVGEEVYVCPIAYDEKVGRLKLRRLCESTPRIDG